MSDEENAPETGDEQAADTATGDRASGGAAVQAAEFPDLGDAAGSGASGDVNLDLIRDINVILRVELGRTDMLIAEVLKLCAGQVIELDKLAGEPLDILINDKLLARGEVVVVDDKFGIRISSIVDPRSRVKAMGGDAASEHGAAAG